MTDRPPIVRWQRKGHYEALGDDSLEDWLRQNHRGRAPSVIAQEMETVVGHAIPIGKVRMKCHRLGLKATDEAVLKAVEKGKAVGRVRPTNAVPGANLDEIWEAAKRLAAALEYKVTEIREIEVDLRDQDKPVCIVELADMHIGGIGVDYEAIEQDGEAIAATDGMFCVLGGDSLDNFIQEFALTGQDAQVVTASVQWKLLERHVGVIQPKTLYAAIGNHDYWTFKRAFVNKFDELVGSFGILDVGHIGVVHLHVGSQEYIIQRAHKFWGRSKMNPLLACQRLLDYGLHPDPDVCIVEHEHVPASGEIHRRGKNRVFIRTGTYKVADPYASEHQFFGAQVAPASVVYWPNEHRIHRIQNVPEAAQYLTYLRSVP